MKSHPQRIFKGVFIPKVIWDNEDLSWMEKCLLAEIDSLEDEEEGCTAGNNYLAVKFKTSANAIAVSLSNLRKYGFINEANFDGKKRCLRVIISFKPKIEKTSSTPLAPPNGPHEPHLMGPLAPPNPEATPHIIQENKEEDAACAAPVDSHHQITVKKFTDLWCQRFQDVLGMKYSFTGGQDRKAADRLVRLLSPEELIAIAVLAWQKPKSRDFWCCNNMSSTISKFASKINEIRCELMPQKKQSSSRSLNL